MEKILFFKKILLILKHVDQIFVFLKFIDLVRLNFSEKKTFENEKQNELIMREWSFQEPVENKPKEYISRHYCEK